MAKTRRNVRVDEPPATRGRAFSCGFVDAAADFLQQRRDMSAERLRHEGDVRP